MLLCMYCTYRPQLLNNMPQQLSHSPRHGVLLSMLSGVQLNAALQDSDQHHCFGCTGVDVRRFNQTI